MAEMSRESLQSTFSFSGFDRLMPFRIRDILLVSSLYDSFIIEQDGRLTEMLLGEYAQLNLSSAPLVTRVSSGEEALEALEEKHFDLVITMTRLGDMAVRDFGRQAKEIRTDLPVVLLVYNNRELSFLGENGLRPEIDMVFIWYGDIRILLAIIKSVEDTMNVAHDTAEGAVRCILLIENSERFYSSYLPIIYTEVMRQTQNLMVEGINVMDKLLRMRARPKILLAENYEEAERIFLDYRTFMLGVITDAQFDHDGVSDPMAGVDFIRMVKGLEPDMPTLLQSSQLERKQEAVALGVDFLHKHSPTLLKDLRGFMKANLGFGIFAFLLPNGTVVGEARDMTAMAKQLMQVPDESIEYHARRNHFSNWFMARTEFDLAMRIRPVKVSEFDSTKEVRQYLLETVLENRERVHRGHVSDFSRQLFFDLKSNFVRIGQGSLGGKGRGLAFVNALLARYDLRPRFESIEINVPPSAIIATDIFDSFLEDNNLLSLAMTDIGDDEISNAFLRARLPDEVTADLEAFLNQVRYPLAVRSSSLLEDSQHQPFAGVYNSHMLPNNHPDDRVRLEQLVHAVKLVYASTFFKSAKTYLQATSNRVEEEKMAVIVQQMVGRKYGNHLYPGIAGAAQSYNYYPMHGAEPEDGAASVVLGLGKAVAEGEQGLLFSPRHPQRLPQFGDVNDYLKHAQREFWALDLSNPDTFASREGTGSLVSLGLDQAEQDGSLSPVGSVYMPDNEAIYDGISRPGVRLITMAGVLKQKVFPLAELLDEILELTSLGMASPVEMEFAANPVPHDGKPAEFAILQVRPLVVGREEIDIDEIVTDLSRSLVYSDQVLGNGTVDHVHDIVMVRPDTFDRTFTPEVALEIRAMNQNLIDQDTPYMLVGPGRWGSRDRWLGIPIEWGDISWARVIVETQMADITVEPSQGSHFFHNLTSFEVGYFTAHENQRGIIMNWDWLMKQPPEQETRFLRHLRFEKPLQIYLDGRHGKGVILPPE
jgi:hypothetical protein